MQPDYIKIITLHLALNTVEESSSSSDSGSDSPSASQFNKSLDESLYDNLRLGFDTD